MGPIRYPLTIFYDASCPLCASEMHALKARDRAGKLELVDCAAPDFDESVLSGLPIRRSDLMTLIHARDAHGRWLRGVDVLAAAYGAVGLEASARIWANGCLRPLWRRLYPLVARNRQVLSRLLAPFV
ncbi:MAG: thiol-disulfide oxidoreductase DCC family protein [Betaproteobacteria bacterium]